MISTAPSSRPGTALALAQAQRIAAAFLLVAAALARASVCPGVANPDCFCFNSSEQATRLPDIRCNFTAARDGPVLGGEEKLDRISLGTVELFGNGLDGLSETSLQGVGKIEKLVLSHNNLTVVPHLMAQLDCLQELDLSHNSITSLPSAALATIPGLQSLDLSHNCLHLLWGDADMLRNVSFNSLITVDLSGNRISSITGKVFAAMPRLLHLDLSHNALTRIDEATFSHLSLTLTLLNLSHNDVQLVAPHALGHLRHLRVLNLSHNLLQNVQQVQFPQHLQSLDLSHCTLTIIDHCQLTDLADLSHIALRGNPLTCTCQLHLLLQWYQNQHHQVSINEPNAKGSNWTCIPPPSSSSTTLPPSHPESTETKPLPGGVKRVSDLKWCEDSESHCQTLEHSSHHRKGSSQVVIMLDVASSGDTLMASWTFQENGEVVVDGFRLKYFPEDGKSFVSPIISADKRSFVMQPMELEKHFVVCLLVLGSEMALVNEKCRSFQDESINILSGILAGTTFILPFAIVLIYVVVKDQKITKTMTNQGVSKDVENGAVTAPTGKPSHDNADNTLKEDPTHALTKDLKSQQFILNDIVTVDVHQCHCNNDTEKQPGIVTVSPTLQTHAGCSEEPAEKGMIHKDTVGSTSQHNTVDEEQVSHNFVKNDTLVFPDHAQNKPEERQQSQETERQASESYTPATNSICKNKTAAKDETARQPGRDAASADLENMGLHEKRQGRAALSASDKQSMSQDQEKIVFHDQQGIDNPGFLCSNTSISGELDNCPGAAEESTHF